MPIFGTVGLGQDIEHRTQIHIQPQSSQFLGLDPALPPGIVDGSGGSHRQIVREHGNAVPEHDDPPAFMVRGHQQFAAESLFQVGNQFFQLRRRVKIDPVENQPAGMQLLKMTDNLRSDPGSGNTDDQPFAHKFG